MSEKVKIILYAVIFIVLVIIVNNQLKKDDVYTNTANVNSVIEENLSQDVVENEDSKVSIEVTEATFESEVLKSDKIVLVDFYADWCNPCKILSPILEEVARENPDIKLVKIDVDTNENLAYEYRAYSIPTLVVIKDGKAGDLLSVLIVRTVDILIKVDVIVTVL